MECLVTHVVNPGEFYAQTGDVKHFSDCKRLDTLIQNYCTTRHSHFHSVDNINVEEIVFLKSELKGGVYARGRVLAIHSDSCSALLIDHGDKETNVHTVLKIDPSVKRFGDIAPFAKKYTLAFVKPIGGIWEDEATQLLRKYSTSSLIYLPTEDPEQITLITRQASSSGAIIDLSVLLIQAGYARRVAGDDDCSSIAPSIAASVSDISQQLHSVGIQTETKDKTSVATSPAILKPPPGFDISTSIAYGAGGDTSISMKTPSATPKTNKSQSAEKSVRSRESNAYVPPALRGLKNPVGKYQSFKLNHDPTCSCLICTLKNVLELPNLSHSERKDTILAGEWSKLTTKEEAILRCSVTGTQLSSEDREFLLDIMLGIVTQHTGTSAGKGASRRKSHDSSTQVTASSNRLTLISYDVENASTTSTSVSDEITIMRDSMDRTFAETTAEAAPAVSPSVADEPPAESRADETSNVEGTGRVLLEYDDPDNWSDPEDRFLELSSDSEPDFILESSASTAVTSSRPSTAMDSNRAGTVIDSSRNEPATSANRAESTYHSTYKGSPSSQTYRSSPYRGGSPSNNRGSPNAYNSSSPNNPSRNMRRFGKPKRPGTTTLLSQGLGLSAAQPPADTPKYRFHANSPSNDTSTDLGGFGTIMYCTFCGATTHSSANCPDGTKNLFIN